MSFPCSSHIYELLTRSNSYMSLLQNSIAIRNSALILSKWPCGIKPSIQTNLLRRATSSEGRVSRVTISRDHGPMREEPLPHIAPVTFSAALNVDVASHTDQGSSGVQGLSATKFSYICDTYGGTRSIYTIPQREIQARAGRYCTNLKQL